MLRKLSALCTIYFIAMMELLANVPRTSNPNIKFNEVDQRIFDSMQVIKEAVDMGIYAPPESGVDSEGYINLAGEKRKMPLEENLDRVKNQIFLAQQNGENEKAAWLRDNVATPLERIVRYRKKLNDCHPEVAPDLGDQFERSMLQKLDQKTQECIDEAGELRTVSYFDFEAWSKKFDPVVNDFRKTKFKNTFSGRGKSAQNAREGQESKFKKLRDLIYEKQKESILGSALIVEHSYLGNINFTSEKEVIKKLQEYLPKTYGKSFRLVSGSNVSSSWGGAYNYNASNYSPPTKKYLDPIRNSLTSAEKSLVNKFQLEKIPSLDEKEREVNLEQLTNNTNYQLHRLNATSRNAEILRRDAQVLDYKKSWMRVDNKDLLEGKILVNENDPQNFDRFKLVSEQPRLNMNLHHIALTRQRLPAADTRWNDPYYGAQLGVGPKYQFGPKDPFRENLERHQRLVEDYRVATRNHKAKLEARELFLTDPTTSFYNVSKNAIIKEIAIDIASTEPTELEEKSKLIIDKEKFKSNVKLVELLKATFETSQQIYLLRKNKELDPQDVSEQEENLTDSLDHYIAGEAQELNKRDSEIFNAYFDEFIDYLLEANDKLPSPDHLKHGIQTYKIKIIEEEELQKKVGDYQFALGRNLEEYLNGHERAKLVDQVKKGKSSIVLPPLDEEQRKKISNYVMPKFNADGNLVLDDYLPSSLKYGEYALAPVELEKIHQKTLRDPTILDPIEEMQTRMGALFDESSEKTLEFQRALRNSDAFLVVNQDKDSDYLLQNGGGQFDFDDVTRNLNKYIDYAKKMMKDREKWYEDMDADEFIVESLYHNPGLVAQVAAENPEYANSLCQALHHTQKIKDPENKAWWKKGLFWMGVVAAIGAIALTVAAPFTGGASLGPALLLWGKIAGMTAFAASLPTTAFAIKEAVDAHEFARQKDYSRAVLGIGTRKEQLAALKKAQSLTNWAIFDGVLLASMGIFPALKLLKANPKATYKDFLKVLKAQKNLKTPLAHRARSVASKFGLQTQSTRRANAASQKILRRNADHVAGRVTNILRKAKPGDLIAGKPLPKNFTPLKLSEKDGLAKHISDRIQAWGGGQLSINPERLAEIIVHLPKKSLNFKGKIGGIDDTLDFFGSIYKRSNGSLEALEQGAKFIKENNPLWLKAAGLKAYYGPKTPELFNYIIKGYETNAQGLAGAVNAQIRSLPAKMRNAALNQRKRVIELRKYNQFLDETMDGGLKLPQTVTEEAVNGVKNVEDLSLALDHALARFQSATGVSFKKVSELKSLKDKFVKDLKDIDPVDLNYYLRRGLQTEINTIDDLEKGLQKAIVQRDEVKVLKDAAASASKLDKSAVSDYDLLTKSANKLTYKTTAEGSASFNKNFKDILDEASKQARDPKAFTKAFLSIQDEILDAAAKTKTSPIKIGEVLGKIYQNADDVIPAMEPLLVRGKQGIVLMGKTLTQGIPKNIKATLNGCKSGPKACGKSLIQVAKNFGNRFFANHPCLRSSPVARKQFFYSLSAFGATFGAVHGTKYKATKENEAQVKLITLANSDKLPEDQKLNFERFKYLLNDEDTSIYEANDFLSRSGLLNQSIEVSNREEYLSNVSSAIEEQYDVKAKTLWREVPYDYLFHVLAWTRYWGELGCRQNLGKALNPGSKFHQFQTTTRLKTLKDSTKDFAISLKPAMKAGVATTAAFLAVKTVNNYGIRAEQKTFSELTVELPLDYFFFQILGNAKWVAMTKVNQVAIPSMIDNSIKSLKGLSPAQVRFTRDALMGSAYWVVDKGVVGTYNQFEYDQIYAKRAVNFYHDQIIQKTLEFLTGETKENSYPSPSDIADALIISNNIEVDTTSLNGNNSEVSKEKRLIDIQRRLSLYNMSLNDFDLSVEDGKIIVIQNEEKLSELRLKFEEAFTKVVGNDPALLKKAMESTTAIN